MPKTKKKASKVRHFQDSWTFKYGVIKKGDQTMCFLCSTTISTKTENVKRHFSTIHKDLSNKSEETIKITLEHKLSKYKSTLSNQTNSLHQFTYTANSIVTSSFSVTKCIVKHGKPLSDGEYLKEAFLACSESLFEGFVNKDKILQRIKNVSLSRNTIKDRVERIEKDRREQLQSGLRSASNFSLALDESNDVSSQARLAIIARYSDETGMREELIKLMTLTKKTRGNAFLIFYAYNLQNNNKEI